MSPKIHSSFWSDPQNELLDSETKYIFLWLITNSQTNILGVCSASPRRFSFETGLNQEALARAYKPLGDAIFVSGDMVFIRNYIRHQFGTGVKLTSNNVFRSIVSLAASIKDDAVLETLCSEYPDIKSALEQGLVRALKPKDKDKDKEKEKEKDYHPDSKIALAFLNEQSGARFRETPTNMGFISARLKEVDVTIDGVKTMIARQCANWKGGPMEKYLRVETLFNKTKFDGYYACKDLPAEPRGQDERKLQVVELERVEGRIRAIKANYDTHMEMSQKDRDEIARLNKRKTELKTLLGFQA